MKEYNKSMDSFNIILGYLEKCKNSLLNSSEKKLYLKEIYNYLNTLPIIELINLLSELNNINLMEIEQQEYKKIINSFLTTLNELIEFLDEKEIYDLIRLLTDSINKFNNDINLNRKDITFTNKLLLKYEKNWTANPEIYNNRDNYTDYISKLKCKNTKIENKRSFYEKYLNKLYYIYNEIKPNTLIKRE